MAAAQATFTAPNGTLIKDYTGDSGFGQFKYGSGAVAGGSLPPWIQNNKLQNANLSGFRAHAVGENLIASDNLDIEVVVTKGASWGLLGGGLVARSNHAAATDVGYDWVEVFEDSQSASQSRIKLDKLISNFSDSTDQSDLLSWVEGETNVIGLNLNGSTATVYWYVASVKTTLFTVDLSNGGVADDLNDAAHGRAGIAMWNSAVVTILDDLTLAFVAGDPVVRIDGLLAKVETTAGTYADPDETTDAVRISKRLWTSIEHERVARNLRRGVASASIIPANPGIPQGPLMFLGIGVELKGLGAAYSDSARHELDALLRACGMSATVDATPGSESLTYAPETTTHETCSIEAYSASLRFKVTGCRGNFMVPVNAGELGLGIFLMKGWLEEDPTVIQLPTITYDDVDPPPWTTSAIAVDGWAAANMVAESAEFDLGQVVKPVLSANPSNGIEEIAIVKTLSMFTVRAETDVSNYEPFANLAVISTGSLNVQMGSTQYNRATLSDSAAQLRPDGIVPIDLNGFTGFELKYFCPSPTLVFD